MYRITTTLGLLLLSFLDVAHAVSCNNVTIADTAAADTVRKACRTIDGNLILDPSLNETLSLDGIETIKGDLVYYGCNPFYNPCPSPLPRFNISSLSLTAIDGGIDIYYSSGLQALLLPNLTRVKSGVSFARMNHLETLDITNLAYVGNIQITAPNLTTLHHDGLRNFTEEDGSVVIGAAAVDSIDSFFRYPLQDGLYPTNTGIWIQQMPNLQRLTIGWANITTIQIDTGAPGLDLTLGAADTTIMAIGELKVQNLTSLSRAASLDSLTLDTFAVGSGSSAMTSLDLPFDQVSKISVYSCDNLQTIRSSPAAVGWEDLDLDIEFCNSLNLSSQYAQLANGTREQIWYWPEKNISSLVIDGGNVSTNFFDTFLSYREARVNSSTVPRVLNQFLIELNHGSPFNCTPFNELSDEGILPRNTSRSLSGGSSNYICELAAGNTASLASFVGSPGLWVIGHAVLVAVVLYI